MPADPSERTVRLGQNDGEDTASPPTVQSRSAWKENPSSVLLFIVVALVPLVLLVVGVALVWIMMLRG